MIINKYIRIEYLSGYEKTEKNQTIVDKLIKCTFVIFSGI